MSSPNSKLTIPSGLQTRVSRYVRRRVIMKMTAGLLLVIASTLLVMLAGAALDHLLMLPETLRRLWLFACLAPTMLGVVSMLHLLMNTRATEADLRLLDNRSDDMRAAMNLADRVAAADPTVNRALAERSAANAATVADAPLPPFTHEAGLIKKRLVLTFVAVLMIVGFRMAAPDLHTVVRRAVHLQTEYGTVGSRKFQFAAEVWTNPAAAPDLDPENAEARAVTSLHFQRETLVGDTWEKHLPVTPDLADRVAGYSPTALTEPPLSVLAGDKVILHFNAVDDRATTTTTDLELLRLEDGRTIPLQYSVVSGTGLLTVPRLLESQRFLLRAGQARSPLYELHVQPRPSPTWLRLYHTPPAHYGQDTQMTVIRDRAAGIDGNRLTGLPGARLAVEFETPYGADLDQSRSYALVAGRRLPLRRLTSRDPALRADGVQAWTVDFTLDDSIVAEPRLYLHLVTAETRFNDEPIVNRYDDPLLVQMMDDQPPTVEITMLPTQTHFEKDAAFAFRYRYTDDHGIAEVGLEIQPNPTSPDSTYVPLDIRPADVAGGVRSHDELMHIIDLKSIRGNYLSFSIVVKDLKGQETKSSSVAIGMTRHFTEELLPKLTGGWRWAYSHNPKNPMLRKGDLEMPLWVKGEQAYAASLANLVQALDAKQALSAKACEQYAKALNYQHQIYLDSQDFESQPFAYHHRDYPYWFRRQGSTYLTGMAEMNGRDVLAEARAALLEMSKAEDPTTSPAYQKLLAQRPEMDAQLALHKRLETLHDEIALRAALMRSAYLCDVISRDLATTTREFERLKADAGAAPADLANDDPWRVYVAWVDTRRDNFDLQQQALLVRLQIRNLNNRMAALNTDLQTIQSLGGTALDPRFSAVVGMVQRFGDSIYSIDRDALDTRLQLLSSFIRDGILVSNSAVYAAVDSQYSANAAMATEALALVPAIADYETQLTAVLACATDISYAQLHRNMGKGNFPADATLKWRRNQESQVRSQLELLNRQASAILYAEPFLSCTDLEATTRTAQEIVQTLKSLGEWRAEWPGLAANAVLIDRSIAAFEAYGVAARRVIDLQRRAGMLADFAPIFTADSPQAGLGTAMAGLATAATISTETRSRVTAMTKLEESRPAVRETEAQQQANAAVDAKLAELRTARDTQITELTTHLTTLADGFKTLAVGPPPEAPVDMGSNNGPPNALIAGVTPGLFDYYRPDTTLARLIADLARYKDQPTQAAAVYEQAVHYHKAYATDAAADVLASPLAEYLRARIALGLIACDPATMGDFAVTYTANGKASADVIYAHMATKDSPEPAASTKEWIAKQNYAPPALAEPFATLAAPYLDAQRKGQLPAYLQTLRSQRLAELQALSQKLGPYLDASEAMIRSRAMANDIHSLLEDVRLYHLEPADIRVADRWARLAEQAQGLDRDLRAGRLGVITAAERTELQQNVGVFQSPTFADAMASETSLAQLRAYRATADAIEARLRPQVMEASRLAVADSANLKRDLSILSLSSLHTVTWYRRKLQAEYFELDRQLAGLSAANRIKAKVGYRSSYDARVLQADANLASFAWRSLVVLKANDYGTKPDAAHTAEALDDLACMLAYKALPEFYYDGFTGRIARRRYAAFNSPDAMVSQMLENLDKGQQTATYLASRHMSDAPPQPPSTNADLQAVLNDLGVFPIIFQIEKDLKGFGELQAWTYGDDASRRRAAAKIRQSYRAQGAFWRELAAPLADYLEAGEPLLATVGQDVDAAQLRAALDKQAAALDAVFRYLDRAGTGLSETELAELAPIIEAQSFTLDWRDALGSSGASGDYHTGYPGMHNTVVSYIKSIHGSLYPELPEYQPRTRYKHALHNFMSFAFDAEILDMEVLWFRRADAAQAEVYRTLLAQADQGLRGEAINPAVAAVSWSDYIDTKFRYLMAYSSPEPGGTPPPAGFRSFDKSLPRHLSEAYSNALGIDLPTQDNALVRELYFDALQESRERSEGQQP